MTTPIYPSGTGPLNPPEDRVALALERAIDALHERADTRDLAEAIAIVASDLPRYAALRARWDAEILRLWVGAYPESTLEAAVGLRELIADGLAEVARERMEREARAWRDGGCDGG